MTPLPWKKALILAPHTDDEYGCAGTIARLVEEGGGVFIYTLSGCEDSAPEGFSRNAMRREALAVACAFGCPVDVAYYDVRKFPEQRQAILDSLRKFDRPDVVFCPSPRDVHQDHATVAAEAIRAFKHTTILGYELPQNNVAFENAVYVHLTEAHVEKKIAALAHYASQAHRPYMDPAVIRSLARVRGMQAGTTYAEAFEPIRIHLP